MQVPLWLLHSWPWHRAEHQAAERSDRLVPPLLAGCLSRTESQPAAGKGMAHRMVLRSLFGSSQTSLFQCPIAQHLFPATLAAQARNLLEVQAPWRGKVRAWIKKSCRALTPFLHCGDTQDDNSSLPVCWLASYSILPTIHKLQPRFLWRPSLCSQERCFLLQQQTPLGESKRSELRPLAKLPDWASASHRAARLIETCWRSRRFH